MDRNKEDGPVSVPAGVFEGIEAVRAEGRVNMLARIDVCARLGMLGLIAAGEWVEANPGQYSAGIFRGFVAQDFWDVPLSDHEDCRCGCGGRRGCGDG